MAALGESWDALGRLLVSLGEFWDASRMAPGNLIQPLFTCECCFTVWPVWILAAASGAPQSIAFLEGVAFSGCPLDPHEPHDTPTWWGVLSILELNLYRVQFLEFYFLSSKKHVSSSISQSIHASCFAHFSPA